MRDTGASLSKQPNIQFDLLTNARDSLKQAVHLLAWKDLGDDHGRLKHSIIAAAHSIELLLKERLRQINPAFVWEKVGKTLTVKAAISRLKDKGGIKLTDKDEENLRSLFKTRKDIQHYVWNTTEKEARVIVGNALSFAFFFAAEYLNNDLAADFKEDDTWRSLINELHEFVRAHAPRIEDDLFEKGLNPSYCDFCGELTVPARGGSCELCGHWQGYRDDDAVIGTDVVTSALMKLCRWSTSG
jgi:hypothetical protein